MISRTCSLRRSVQTPTRPGEASTPSPFSDDQGAPLSVADRPGRRHAAIVDDRRGLVLSVRVNLSQTHLKVDGGSALLSASMSASVEIVTGKTAGD